MLFSFFQGIYNYIPVRIHVPTVYHVAAVLCLQFMVHVIIIIIYFYVSIFLFLNIFMRNPYIFIVYYFLFVPKMHIYILNIKLY